VTRSGLVPPLAEAVLQLHEAALAKKCWSCACFRTSMTAIALALSNAQRPVELRQALTAAEERLAPTRYDCLGCEVCYPALAINALNQAGFAVAPDACPTEPAVDRTGWPPLPGSYKVLRRRAPVAVCALTDDALAETVARAAHPEIAIVGTLQTENLGVERLIQNVVANPSIRFLVLCGADSRKKIGHLPGQSLGALARAGLDEHSRIIGAAGKRPVLCNVSPATVEYFRRTVEVVDLIGEVDVHAILAAGQSCAARNPGPAEPFTPQRLVQVVHGYVAERMISDPSGYFVVYTDRSRALLSLEHYADSGVLDAVIEGQTAAEVYTPAIERGLLSRLDHAAYLGRELARAEQSLRLGEAYVQDAAPERANILPVAPCGCASPCREEKAQ
jgi:tetrahydromethanopterin S-methyltransferase subunit A